MIYVASKTKHAPMWRDLRAQGVPITSTWIDEAEPGQTKDLSELAQRCINEVYKSAVVLLYCEKGDNLKGAFIETGAALAFARSILCVDPSSCISSIFKHHPNWLNFNSIEEALAEIGVSKCSAKST